MPCCEVWARRKFTDGPRAPAQVVCSKAHASQVVATPAERVLPSKSKAELSALVYIQVTHLHILDSVSPCQVLQQLGRERALKRRS